MFMNAYEFNYDLSNWNIGSVTAIYSMFANARSFNQTLCWEIPDTVETTDMFLGTSSSLGCPPTGNPTEFPTNLSSSGPTYGPTESQFPTTSPTKSPTSEYPTQFPSTTAPTEFPTDHPSPGPTEFPSTSPTKSPTSDYPTQFPSSSAAPTEFPIDHSSPGPTEFPSTSPTKHPTVDYAIIFASINIICASIIFMYCKYRFNKKIQRENVALENDKSTTEIRTKCCGCLEAERAVHSTFPDENSHF